MHVRVHEQGRAELIVLLAMELIKGDASAWGAYLRSLPLAEHAAPPSLWASLCGESAAAELLMHTSVGAAVEEDAVARPASASWLRTRQNSGASAER